MIDTNGTFWGGNAKNQQLVTELSKLIPNCGEVRGGKSKNKALERFRKAQNAYYDLYNNGLINRAASFSKVFGISSSHHKRPNGKFDPVMYTNVEKIMNEIVIAAAEEQGIK